jgi:4-amino-4-deoxy-L-arabinose transferase-like glycosyltransferase
MTHAAGRRTDGADWRAAILLAAGLTLARIVVLFRTPLELYPDEAQYWLWSRTLDFGYYSKPPMIAWTIWATTALGGNAEAWVRLGAPLFQAGAMLLVFAIARRLYDSRVALAAAALYALAPAIQLSAAVMATDAPLLFFLGVTLLAYVALQQAEGRRRIWLAAGFGAGLGLAFLSKYAAVYALIGAALHALVARDARRAWSPGAVGAAVLAFLLVLAPNLVWNAQHGFATVQHTAANAAWGGRKLFNFAELGQFVATQFLVFGPIPFGALVVGVVLAVWRRRISREDLLLLCFVLPPLVIVTVQAFISRANANWSGASYLPGAALTAAWLMRWRARRWLVAALAMQALIAAVFLAFVISPGLADKAGAANSFKRARGWSQASKLIVERARTEELGPGGISAITVDNRFLYYALRYYGRDYFAEGGHPPLKAWMLTGRPENQAESSAPLTPADGARVLAVSYENWNGPFMAADFARTLGREIASVRLDPKHRRRIVMFVGEGFSPRPRDPVTGRPTPP